MSEETWPKNGGTFEFNLNGERFRLFSNFAHFSRLEGSSRASVKALSGKSIIISFCFNALDLSLGLQENDMN